MKRTYSVRGAIFRGRVQRRLLWSYKSGDEAPAFHFTRYKLRKRIALVGKGEESLSSRDVYRLIRWRVQVSKTLPRAEVGAGRFALGFGE